jgi:hypothetical protein
LKHAQGDERCKTARESCIVNPFRLQPFNIPAGRLEQDASEQVNRSRMNAPES